MPGVTSVAVNLAAETAAVERSAAGANESRKKDQLGLGPVAGWTEAASTWDEDAAGGSFSIEKPRAGDSLKWLRYRHIVPTNDDWDAAGDGPLRPSNSEFS